MLLPLYRPRLHPRHQLCGVLQDRLGVLWLLRFRPRRGVALRQHGLPPHPHDGLAAHREPYLLQMDESRLPRPDRHLHGARVHVPRGHDQLHALIKGVSNHGHF